jgi:flagellar assembly factor FliW
MTIDFTKAPAMELAYWNRCALKTVRQENVFRFPEGLLGFPDIKEYVFILNDKVKPFMFMHALDGSDICFVCVESFLICPSYQLKLPDSLIDALEIETPADVLLFNLVTVKQKLEEISANMVSPLVINIKKRMGRQMIVENSEFPMRYKIWDAISKSDAGAAIAAMAV